MPGKRPLIGLNCDYQEHLTYRVRDQICLLYTSDAADE